MTRRGFIAGATAMAAGLAMPGVVKSAAAARSTIFRLPNLTFHGSDGKLTWNGSEWVFTAE